MAKALINRPTIPNTIRPWFEAFMTLHSQRQGGMASVQPLTVEAIILYAQTHDFEDDVPLFLKLMARMDRAAMKYMAERSKARAKAPVKPAPSAPRRGRRR